MVYRNERRAATVITSGLHSLGSNKPMVATAPTSLNHYAPGPLRHHIGRPLGSQKSGGRQGGVG